MKKEKRGLLPQNESVRVVKALGNCLPQQRVSNEFYSTSRSGGITRKEPPRERPVLRCDLEHGAG